MSRAPVKSKSRTQLSTLFQNTLTLGALPRICQEYVQEPVVLQLLSIKALKGKGYRLILNDGEYRHDLGMLSAGLSYLVKEDKISQFTVVKVSPRVARVQGGPQGWVRLVKSFNLKPDRSYLSHFPP